MNLSRIIGSTKFSDARKCLWILVNNSCVLVDFMCPLDWITGCLQSLFDWTKRHKKGKFSLLLLELGYPYSPVLGHYSSWFWGLQKTNCTISSAFLVLQFADSRLRDFGSTAAWVNSYNRSLYVSLYILLVLCLWWTLTEIVFLPLYFYSSNKNSSIHKFISRWLSFVFLSADVSQSRWAVYQNGKLEIY